ncbi:MAG: DUF3419 family protein [Pseudomonadota bacterium]|nr:DUF3419 family protein [Pseudomonadota bacterium]
MRADSTASTRPPAPPASSFVRAWSWEDPALLGLLAVGPEDDVAVFEPSGDDALALCAIGARSVHAVVPDLASRALVELKQAASRELPTQSVWSLLGLGHFGRRVWFYHFLRPKLSTEVQGWWDAREGAIRAGIAGEGVVERAIATLRTRVLPLAVGRGAVAALLAAPTLDTQREVVRAQWRGVRWRAVSRVWLPRLARLAEADEDRTAAHLDALMERVPLASSPFVGWLLGGTWGDPERAPPWMSTAGLAALKPRAAGLSLAIGDRPGVLAAAPRGAWSAAVLGRRPLSSQEADALTRCLRPGARVLGWGPPPSQLTLDPTATAALAALDRGLFPGRPWLARHRG